MRNKVQKVSKFFCVRSSTNTGYECTHITRLKSEGKDSYQKKIPEKTTRDEEMRWVEFVFVVRARTFSKY